MLTGKVREKIDLPHEPGQWIEVRQPSAQHLTEAREAKADANLRAGRRWLEGVALRRQFMPEEEQPLVVTPDPEPTTEAVEPVPEVETDPLVSIDAFTLLRRCIVAWSYPEPVTVGNIDELDEETAEYVARKIAPKVRTEAALPNASAPSTTPSKDAAPTPPTGSTPESAKKD